MALSVDRAVRPRNELLLLIEHQKKAIERQEGIIDRQQQMIEQQKKEIERQQRTIDRQRQDMAAMQVEKHLPPWRKHGLEEAKEGRR